MLDDNEYGDEAFESEDLSPSRRSAGDELGNLGEDEKDPSRGAASVGSETNSEVEMQVNVGSTCAHDDRADLVVVRPTTP